MAKKPEPPEPATTDEYDTFEQTIRTVLSVPKTAIDEAVKRERDARANAED